MIGTPLTFKALLTRKQLSEDTFRRFLNKIEEIRRMSQSVVEYLLLIHKGMQMYHGSLVKQCQILEAQINNDMNDDKRYYLQFAMIFQTVSINFEHFNTTFESNLKEYHVSTCMQIDQLTTSHLDPLMNSFKKYKTAEEAVMDSGKKWLKGEKHLSDSIRSYNESLVDPRLIYNKEQTNKRYFNCEASYHNVIKQQVTTKQKVEKLNETKKACIHFHNKFIDEHNNSYAFVHQKIIMEAKNILTLFSNVHKMVVSDIATKKKGFEETEIAPFLFSHPDIDNEKHFFNLPPGYKASGHFPIFLENPECIKDVHLKLYYKWLTEYGQFLKDCGENSKRLMKRLLEFLVETTKATERMSNFIIKQMPIFYQKLKKKILQMFDSKTLDFIKSINATLETSMRIYEKLIKVSYQKLENINYIIGQDQKMGEMFFREYNKQLELFNNETKLLNPNQNQKQIRNAINQKASIIKYCLTTFGEKITKNNGAFRLGVKGILGQIFSSFNQIFIYSSEYQHTYFGMEFIDNLGTIKAEILEKGCSIETISNDVAKELVEIQEVDRFKYTEFQKIKKADSVLPKEDKQNKQAIDTASTNQGVIQRSLSVSSPLKKQSIDIDIKERKNYDFLSKKITFEEGQQFKHTFKCALYDKILLQGKLYVTNLRLCFHSYFNTANLFFGTTFLQIPKKDILKAEKRYNAKIFDNSVSITTVNGEVFFTSFFSRDIAYQQIVETFGLKVEENEENNEEDQQEKVNDTEQVTEAKQQIETIEQPIVENEADDITEQQLLMRAEKLQEVTNNKMEKICTNTIKHASCLYLLKKFFNNQEYTSSGKKYPSFYEFLKQGLGEKQFSGQKWEPDIQVYLNKKNIKKDTPLRFNRKCRFNHTLPKSSIPFMPKFCKTEESQRMSIISANRFIIDFKVTSTGAPYVDTFILYTRQDYTDVSNGVQLTVFMHIEFIKKSMMQGIITKQSSQSLAQGQESQAKFINKIVSSDPIFKKKPKAVKLEATSTDGVVENQTAPEGTNDEKQDEPVDEVSQNYEKKYAELLKQHEELQKKYSLLKYIIIGLIVFSILALIF